MQEAIQEFTIGFYDSSGVFSIYAKEDDTERTVKFHLYDEGNEYTDLLNTGNLTAFVREELPSGGALPDIEIPSSYIDAENSSITVPLTADMLQEPGVALCDLLFMERVSTTEFNLLSTTRFKLIISDNVGTPKSGVTKEWFENWTELYIHLKILESQIEDGEDERQNNETIRVDNENERISAENIRVSNENTRISNETTREDNETVRQANEAARAANETERGINETQRQDSETARATAESERQQAELVRESKVQGQVDEAHKWANGNTSSTAPEDTPSATNNAMYWCQQAHQIYDSVFNGTVAEWNALSLGEKAKYVTVLLIDD